MPALYNPFGGAARALKSVPGPRPLPVVGNALSFNKPNAWTAVENWVAEHDTVCLTWILGKPVVILCDPRLVTEVLIDRRRDFYKKDPVAALTPILTAVAPFLGNLPDWESMAAKDLPALPGFGKWLLSQSDVIRRTVAERLTALAGAGEQPDATRVLREISWDCWTRMAFGEDVEDGGLDDLLTLAEIASERLSALDEPGPEISDDRFDPTWARWVSRFEPRVAAARAAGEARGDLLGLLVEAGSDLSDQELAVAFGNLYFGGLFSSTTGWATGLWALTNHPDERDTLRAALDALPAEPSFNDFVGCGPLDSAVREALRVRPPVPIYMRNTAVGTTTELGGHTLPSDTTLFISPWAMMRCPRHWTEPDAFQPGRWTDAVKDDNPYGGEWFHPFGRGARRCSAHAWGLMHITVALATAVRDFDVQVGPGAPYASELFFAVQAPTGWTLTVTARDRSVG